MNSFRSLVSSLVVVLLLVGSNAQAKGMSLQPDPGNHDSLESQLKRFKGQTKFLNYQGMISKGASMGRQMEAGSQGAQRAQQESDVFKVGKPGSKELFLLNNYRGLQAVSFARGIENPSLIGRAAPTGNYPDDMYFDAARDRLVVLERLYFDDEGNYNYSDIQSRVLVYDVSKAENPRIVQELPIEGEIADSRMVGDILYVATSVRPDYRAYAQNTTAKGLVYSLRLESTKIEVVEKVALALPTSSRENMNIVEIEEDGNFRYYLVAILSESGWGWWDRQSLVEVVDISDAQGKVKPVMVISAKGRVTERSQTHIKNGTLIVTSNYTPSGENALMRIAVETFKLPTATSEIISEDEAQFRKLNIERQLVGKTGDERDALNAKLVADATLGIADRFVKTATGQLRKILPDAVVTVGDTTGLNATLQDVRYVGNLLYVFWVPQNLVDPFDLFDISQPEREVRYLKRLQFDGWIERSIPVRYADRDFVLGLGYIVPAEGNENGRRYLQAKLFEVVGKGVDARTVDIAGIALDKGNLWTNFNSADKYVEMRLGADGRGTILFQATAQVESRYVNGGKLIEFNLDAAVKNETSAVFKEGAMLSASSDWLRRVFTNSEIDRVNTFSDSALGTFDVNTTRSGSVIAESVSVLELARNISAYVDLPVDGKYSRGIQIIQQGSIYDAAPKTILRVVEARRADTEKEAVHATLALDGEYEGHLVDRRDGTLVVATRYRQPTEANRYRTGQKAHRVSLTTAGLQTLKSFDLGVSESSGWYSGGTQLLQTPDGEILLHAQGQISRLQGEAGVRLVLQGCPGVVDHRSPELILLGGNFYMASTTEVLDPSRRHVTYLRHTIAPITLDGGSAECGAAINIPGKPIAIHADGHLVTEDSRLVDLRRIVSRYEGTDGKVDEMIYWRGENELALESLRVANGTATLVDDYLVDGGRAQSHYRELGGKRLGFFESEEGNGYRAAEYATFVSIDFDGELNFTREVTFTENVAGGSSLAAVIADPAEAGAMFGIVAKGRRLQVVRWAPKAARPIVMRIAMSDVHFEKTAPAESVRLPEGVSTWSTPAISYNPALRSFQIPLGMSGVSQIFLE